jgi:hypothetical protein
MTNTTTTTSSARTENKVSEIDGYLELGMEEEALELIGVALANQNVSAEEFNTCVFALLQVQEPGKWRTAVEAGYKRLQEPVDDAVRANMLNYYFVIREPELAFQCFPGKGRTRFFDLWVMMQVCLDLSRLKEARKIARLCSRRMGATDSDFI